jgi:SAM-dependent methyltransferase
MRLLGLNIDRRQIDICRSLTARPGNSLSFVLADACALPCKPGSFDRLLCLEAMFHFASRRAFLQQAADALCRGGRLAFTDILLANPAGHAPVDIALLERIIRHEYGPWPDLWTGRGDILALARQSGLVPNRVIDATDQTLPTYRMTAPGDDETLLARPSAGNLMRWLHRNGYLSYLCFSFTKA